ncbi:hypothetical protein FHETE_10982 [Fusarium heterosporum]|uniref:F-box domain-containing protein n=1 Tax=Fusarium heterosporum TaxID=42747 RepID=A0A8H5SRL0_FUSHE|nr:hypothetical protein FHETE_10982 [Fusarium heterosporum]
MAVLSDLPDETLERVVEFITNDRESLDNVSLVNSRFDKIVFPLPVRTWSNSQESAEPSIALFALHLLRHPELRKQVQSLDLGYLRPFHEPPLDSELSPEHLTALANAAAQDVALPEAWLEKLCSQIRQGCEDALAVLILAWSTRLTQLSITTPHFDPEFGCDFMLLIFTKKAVYRLLDKTGEMEVPLQQVRHVTFQSWNRLQDIGRSYARMFFHLPMIKTITTHEISDDMDERIDDDRTPTSVLQNYGLSLPIGLSTVQELIMTRSGLLGCGLSKFISACRPLEKVVIHVDHDLANGAMPDQEELASALMRHKRSLTELHLDMDGWGCSASSHCIRPGIGPILQDLYQSLSSIRGLTMTISHLFDDTPPGDEESIKIKLDRIPRSTHSLKLHCRSYIENWTSNDVFMEPYLEGVIELLEEAGPQGQLSELRVFDLSEAFVDDTSMVDIRKIKEQAEFSGVKILLCTQK